MEYRAENIKRTDREINRLIICQKSGEISLLKQQLKDVQADLGQKAAEIVALKAQLREARSELQASQVWRCVRTSCKRRKSEAELLREKLGRLEEESSRLRAVQATLPAFRDGEEQLLAYESDEAKAQRQSSDALHTVRQQVERLRAELLFERRRGQDQLESFDDERRVWQEEKDKVIRYQKQLQRVMRELSLELENRDMEEYDMRSNEIHFEEITATEI
uniref:Uncharacterized protein n=1 Tax=Astyanax mexicanus TaxID=7994 RepID=A0A3B1J649_ASTMX